MKWFWGILSLVLIMVLVVILDSSSKQYDPSKPIISFDSQNNPTEGNDKVTPSDERKTNRKECLDREMIRAKTIWMHDCFLEERVSPQCKNFFDSYGAYIPSDRSGFDNDFMICSCQLPDGLASQLNMEHKSADDFCYDADIYPI